MAGISKIILDTDAGERVLVDLTGDNVTADSLVVGSVAHGADGEIVEGANPYELEATNTEVGTQTDLIAQIQAALEGKAAGGSGGSGKPEQEKTVEITENGAHTVTPDDGYTMSKVTVNVNVPSEEPVTEELRVTANGTYTPSAGVDGYSKVTVQVPSDLPDTVEQATPAISVSSSGKITATSTQTAGYVEGGTKTATKQLTTKGATTITPTSSVQTAVQAGTYVTGDIKVAAVSGSSGSGSKITVVNNTNSRISFGGYMLCSKSWAEEGLGIASCEIDISEIAALIEDGLSYFMSFVFIDGGAPSVYSITGSGVDLSLETPGMDTQYGMGFALCWVTRLTAGGTITINKA